MRSTRQGWLRPSGSATPVWGRSVRSKLSGRRYRWTSDRIVAWLLHRTKDTAVASDRIGASHATEIRHVPEHSCRNGWLAAFGQGNHSFDRAGEGAWRKIDGLLRLARLSAARVRRRGDVRAGIAPGVRRAMQEGGRSDLKRHRRQGQSGGYSIHGGAGRRGGTVESEPGCREIAEMRRDRHGIAWTPRRIGASPRQ